jgi:hypothetical protein
MALKRVLLLTLIGAALLTAHRSFGSPTHFEEEVGSTVSQVTAAARIGEAIGRAGAFIAAPLVRSITTDTERLLRELEPAMERAPLRDSRQARKLASLIAQLDSAALQGIKDGRPIEALKLAAEGRSLVPDVRQVLAEENAFR